MVLFPHLAPAPAVELEILSTVSCSTSSSKYWFASSGMLIHVLSSIVYVIAGHNPCGFSAVVFSNLTPSVISDSSTWKITKIVTSGSFTHICRFNACIIVATRAWTAWAMNRLFQKFRITRYFGTVAICICFAAYCHCHVIFFHLSPGSKSVSALS